MLLNTVFECITGFVACRFVLSFLSYVHNAKYQLVTYVHGQFTENTFTRVSWTWGCKPQSDATRTAGNVHMAAQTVMGAWLIAAIFLEVCLTPRAISSITSNGARMGMPMILPIAEHTMRSVSWTPINDKTCKLEAPVESANWSVRDHFGRHVMATIWKPCVSVLMNVTGQCTVRAADH